MERLKTVVDILDKVEFFQGQRAGRELWNDKPVEVQEEDLENFKRDINTIRSYIWKVVKELQQYRYAEDQGLLLRLPCKVGSMVYEIKKDLNQMKRETIEHNGHYYHRNIDVYYIAQVTFEIEDFAELGKTVFITKEEAEQALAKMKEV